jgi:nucleolar protein 53
VTLPEDLQDSLRRLKPEGNLLTDRYRNLLVNGKVEVRKKVGQSKKKQVFAREKWTYKDFKLK